MEKVNLKEKFSHIDNLWSPKIAGEINNMHVKLARIQGEFLWHHHETEDEMFLVVKGRMRMQFREGEVVVDEGEFIVVPHGVEHRPVAEHETHIMLIEPAGTLNTGTIRDERTIDEPGRI